jgi:uncharacterized protein YbgA (DUF1722 family)
MNQNISALERAFAIARSGQAATVDEIKAALHREGYLSNQLEGPLLRSQLKAFIKAAREGEQRPIRRSEPRS